MTPTRIRELISYAQHARRDLERKPIPAFLADALVGELLDKMIADLKALDIPKRMTAERIVREAEIGACEDLQRRWLKGRGQSAPIVEFVNVGEAITEARREPEPEERIYGRDGVVLRVIDGGKK